MKKFAPIVMMVAMFIIGFVNGIIQYQTIDIRHIGGLVSSNGDWFLHGKKSGFVNTEKNHIISKNHLIHIAKKELSDSERKQIKHIIVYRCEPFYWEITFGALDLNSEQYEKCMDDSAITVFLDKDGITQLVSGPANFGG